MDCHHRIEVPLRSGGGKKMKKRRELDALITHSITKRGARSNINSQDKLLSVSTDDPDDYAWMNVSGTTRRNHRKMYFRKCGPFIFGVSTVFAVTILYWLYFDLRQQISDYHQKIEEVSAMSKIFPDTLQHWHETTSFLIKNQTSVLCQLNGLTQNVENLGRNLSSLTATVNAQRNFGREDKLVADFGAKLEAVSSDIEGIKEHYNRYIELQKNVEQETEAIKANISQLFLLKTNSPPTNITNNVKNLNQTIQNSLKEFENHLMDVNNTLSQTIQILNGEISVHKTKLDDLLDRSENVTSHVATLSNNWPDLKQKLVNIEEQLNKIKEKVLLLENQSHLPCGSIDQLMDMCEKRNDIVTTQINQNNNNNTEEKASMYTENGLATSLNGTGKFRDNPKR